MSGGRRNGLRQALGLPLGVVVAAAVYLAPQPEGLSAQAQAIAAVAVLMATWWMSEALPIAATALLPIVLFPALDAMPVKQVTLAYANHLVYLFLGGFMMALAIERWQLHRRIALRTLLLVGTSPTRVILGFMLATAFLSAWISNTASAMLMVTIGVALLGQLDTDADTRGFGTALMLGIAYAASIGGIATLIGTPPNAILAGVAEQAHGIHIGFARWLAFGLPLSLAMLLLTWWYLVRGAFRLRGMRLPMDPAGLRAQHADLGRMDAAERRVLAVFALVVACWLLRGLADMPLLTRLGDSGIAIAGALLMYALPAGPAHAGERLLDWQCALRVPWDIIILFGGGFALAAGFADSGLTSWIGGRLGVLQDAPQLLLLAGVVTLVIFLTEVTSNTATASLLLPVLGGFALAMQQPPLPLLVAAALAASLAFMLPVATPPNAIVFGSRRVSIPQMARAGIWLNLLGIVLVTAAVQLLLPLLFGPAG